MECTDKCTVLIMNDFEIDNSVQYHMKNASHAMHSNRYNTEKKQRASLCYV